MPTAHRPSHPPTPLPRPPPARVCAGPLEAHLGSLPVMKVILHASQDRIEQVCGVGRGALGEGVGRWAVRSG